MTQTAGINLLPSQSREEKLHQARQGQLTLVGIGLGAVGVLLVAASYGSQFYLDRMNDSVNARLSQANKQLASLQQLEIQDRSLSDKLTKIQALLSGYPHNSQLLNDIASFTPSGVRLTSLIFDQTGKVAVSGLAIDPATFGNFMATLRDPNRGGAKFANVQIDSLTGGGDQNQYHFTVSMTGKGL